MSTPSPAESHLVNERRGSVGVSAVWALPLVAILLTLWALWQSYVERGPLIEISFENAGGVTAGETRVRRNDVDVGSVESVKLSDDLNSVVVGVRMSPQVGPFLNKETRFWIINARLTTTEISGLSTLLSGSYIEVDWDGLEGEGIEEYVGLTEPPLTQRGEPGLRLSLSADEAGYIYVGSPVFYRQIEVGRVERRTISPDATQVMFDIFIEAPHHLSVYPETRFFGVSGVEGSVGPEGANVRMESISAFLTGGLAFETLPEDTEVSPVSDNAKIFTLFDSRSVARDNMSDGDNDERFRFTAVFDGSVKGLREGASIDYNGSKIGKVHAVAVSLPEGPDDNGKAVVTMQFYPLRLGIEGISQESWFEKFESLVASGMRLQLASGNLLTGSLIVQLVSKPEAPRDEINFAAKPYPVLPVMDGNTDALTADVEVLVNNLSQLPLDSLVVAATRLLNDTRSLIASPDVVSLPGQVATTMEFINQASADLPAMMRSLTLASQNANEVLEGLSPDSEIYIELSATARELTEAAKSIAAFAAVLEENPSAVLTGR